MKTGVNCGHTIDGPGYGAAGILKESNHTRLVGYALMEKLKAAGIEAVDCTVDQAATQQEYLAGTVTLANREDLDWFISIHFNASAAHTGQGVEVYTYKGQRYPEALELCTRIAAFGFKNRGIKDGSGLYVIRHTKAKAMLIEVCFCDNAADVEIYNHAGGPDAMAQAIYEAISKCTCKNADEPYNPSQEDHSLSTDAFIEFVGTIAARDWQERRIMLPSVVVAQAVKESARGTSELAQKANALFGIKVNGWTGKTYRKAATEQRPDGSYYTVDNTEWRAYDSWEESILDHNSYIATRSTDGGKTLRYGPVIGCGNYVLAAQYLQECGYATSLTYAASLINDYIEKYKLTRFDEAEKTAADGVTPDKEEAPEGYACVVSAGIYKKSRDSADSRWIVKDRKMYYNTGKCDK